MSGSKRPRTSFDEPRDFEERPRLLDEWQAAVDAGGRKLHQTDSKIQESNAQEKEQTILNLLTNHEQHYTVFDGICSYLGIAEIIALTRTCKKLSGLYQRLLKTQWNIDRQLRRFVNNPKGFRAQLGRNDALLSGDFALQFFERRVWQDGNMELFAYRYSEVRALESYLVEVEDYMCSNMTPSILNPDLKTSQKIASFAFLRR
ncbi:hypothetical protein MMC34_006866 [Xylographa carneopallida]|nr:hypothetical protein [Xylographa carneopallida]